MVDVEVGLGSPGNQKDNRFGSRYCDTKDYTYDQDIEKPGEFVPVDRFPDLPNYPGRYLPRFHPEYLVLPDTAHSGCTCQDTSHSGEDRYSVPSSCDRRMYRTLDD